jgi:hypothetical protein
MKKLSPLLLLNLAVANISFAAVMPAHIMDAIYYWPQPVHETTVNMNIINDPGINSYYFWAHFFSFTNTSSSKLRMGYTGLQTVGNGKKAIFSIWNALGAVGPACKTFGGEGIGWHCYADVNFVAGRSYRFRVWRMSSDSTGDWWGSFVSDTATNRETVIGFIKSPPNSGLINQSNIFVEYWQNVTSCMAMPYSKVGFSNMMGNVGTVRPNYNSWIPQNACRNNVYVTFTGNDFVAATPKP